MWQNLNILWLENINIEIYDIGGSVTWKYVTSGCREAESFYYKVIGISYHICEGFYVTNNIDWKQLGKKTPLSKDTRGRARTESSNWSRHHRGILHTLLLLVTIIYDSGLHSQVSTNHSGVCLLLSYPPLVMKMPPQIFWQAILMGHFLNWNFSSKITTCVKLTKKLTRIVRDVFTFRR